MFCGMSPSPIASDTASSKSEAASLTTSEPAAAVSEIACVKSSPGIASDTMSSTEAKASEALSVKAETVSEIA